MAELKPMRSAKASYGSKFQTILTVLALAFASASAPAMGQSDISPLGTPQETYLDAAEISGTVVAGLQFSGTPSPRRPALTALIPANWRGHDMCIRLASADGRYVAMQAYAISEAWAGGLVPLLYETAYVQQLLGYDATDMAIRIARGSCEEPEGVLAIAGWNIEHQNAPESAFLLINSFRADETYLIDRVSGADYDCKPLDGQYATSFDTICPLPISAMAGEGEAELEVNRIRRGTFDPPELVVIEKAAL